MSNCYRVVRVGDGHVFAAYPSATQAFLRAWLSAFECRVEAYLSDRREWVAVTEIVREAVGV